MPVPVLLTVFLSARKYRTPGFIPQKKEKVSKVDYSSKAKISNVRDGGWTVKPARARRARCVEEIYGNLREPALAPRARYAAISLRPRIQYEEWKVQYVTHTCRIEQLYFFFINFWFLTTSNKPNHHTSLDLQLYSSTSTPSLQTNKPKLELNLILLILGTSKIRY